MQNFGLVAQKLSELCIILCFLCFANTDRRILEVPGGTYDLVHKYYGTEMGSQQDDKDACTLTRTKVSEPSVMLPPILWEAVWRFFI